MKTLALIFSLALCAPAFAREIPTVISPKEAANYVGVEMGVSGKIVQVVQKKGNIYLNFEQPYPKQPFYGFIPAKSVYDIERRLNPERLEGQTVILYGKIALWKGNPQIVITSPNQIQERVQGYLVPGVNSTQ